MTAATGTGAGAGTTVAGTTPYPWPWDGDLTASATTLLVVAEGGGAASTPDAALRARLHALAVALRGAGGRVVAVTTRRPARAGGPGPGSTSAAPAWTGLLDAALVDDAVVAQGLDAYHGSDLELVLATTGARRLLVAGSQLEVSVHSTLRSANDRGLECLLVVDACVPAEERLVAAAVSTVEMSGGIFGAVGTTAAVVDALALLPTP